MMVNLTRKIMSKLYAWLSIKFKGYYIIRREIRINHDLRERTICHKDCGSNHWGVHCELGDECNDINYGKRTNACMAISRYDDCDVSIKIYCKKHDRRRK